MTRPRRSSATVGGIDGCRDGWVLVSSGARRGSSSRVDLLARFEEAVTAIDRLGLVGVGVDMPIGLPARGRRACDTEARTRLGPRRSSMFPTPPRALLGATTYAEALERSRALDGRGISVQAYNLLPQIAEVDDQMTPARQSSIFECHPESSFAALAGAPLRTVKRTTEGQHERIALLLPHFPDVAEHVTARPRRARPDDVLDAFAIVWSARRHRRGHADVLGDAEVDARGLRMELVI